MHTSDERTPNIPLSGLVLRSEPLLRCKTMISINKPNQTSPLSIWWGKLCLFLPSSTQLLIAYMQFCCSIDLPALKKPTLCVSLIDLEIYDIKQMKSRQVLNRSNVITDVTTATELFLNSI